MPNILARLSSAVVFLILAAFPGSSGAYADEPRPSLVDIGGVKLNSILIKAGRRADLPPIVFIHGASASLYDPMFSFRTKLEGRADLLFVDRPGHGASDAGNPPMILPDGQADAIAQLMKKRGIGKAIIVGHSFGGAIAAALALRHPEKVAGLVLLSPAVYPWEGGVAWYYDAATVPVTGPLFSALIVPPVGLLAIDRSTNAVFWPNHRPANYVRETRAVQALRPAAFWHNAMEVKALSSWAKTASLKYSRIKAPTVIITGDADKIVSPAVHAQRLARDISRAKLVVVHNLGHKSDYVASDLAIEAIKRVAGQKANLAAVQKTTEQRIAGDGKR
ncbi:esterase [Rhizobium sp. Root708]|uniref:alpha/beta fold hydrolase n=1 Tax=Rhizobium sp. Root708 TaxID=1736592 RepID=UPI00070187B3|nr:alpha/beta hydrolase [Rhizobium sp. Root708]KRB62083.1 esterase [Rhizobium sp. Root708]